MDSTSQITNLGLLSLAVFAVPAVVSWLDRRRHQDSEFVHAWANEENMPDELRWGSIYMNEQTISIADPVHLRARVDQVYLTQNNVLVISDTKTRRLHRAYESDILQLSIYALILRHQVSIPVARHGYVRSVIFDGNERRSVRYHKVRLLSDREVLSRVEYA